MLRKLFLCLLAFTFILQTSVSARSAGEAKSTVYRSYILDKAGVTFPVLFATIEDEELDEDDQRHDGDIICFQSIDFDAISGQKTLFPGIREKCPHFLYTQPTLPGLCKFNI